MTRISILVLWPCLFLLLHKSNIIVYGQVMCFKYPQLTFGDYFAICDDFSDWSQLNTFLADYNRFEAQAYMINLKPNKPLILTSQLNLSLIQIVYAPTSSPVRLNMIDLAGMEVFPFTSDLWYSGNAGLSFVQSQINFFLNGTLASRLECTQFMIPSQNASLFTSFGFIAFMWKNSYPTEPVCPFLFVNATMDAFIIFGLVDNSILIRNLWRFENIKNTTCVTIGSHIKQFEVSGYGFTLDTGLMDPLVFQQVETVKIFSSIDSIQADLFSEFSQISGVQLQLESYNNFFHKIGIKWTESIKGPNSYVTINLFNYNDSVMNWIDGGAYTFPGQDFCLFSQWPHQNYIIPIFDDSFNLPECTMTLRWLLLNYFNNAFKPFLFTYVLYKNSSVYLMCANSVYWNEMLANDSNYFEKKISKCKLNQGGTSINAETYQVKYILEFIQDLVEFIAIPLVSALGLFFNAIIIWTINKNKELKDQFYKYMQLNAFCNCLYCVLFLFYPINSCVDTLSNGYFCSSIRQNYVTQYYKIVFLAYFGESIKMCANIFYILIAVNRYMLIGKDGHLTIFESISNWNMNWIIGATVFLSLTLNICHIWEYVLNTGLLCSQILFWPEYIYFIDTYPFVGKDLGYFGDWHYVLSILFIVYFIINYFVFWLVNTIVEVILVKKLHTVLEAKKKRMSEMTSSITPTTAAQPEMSFCKKRKLEMEAKTEQRATIMVVTNSLINFFLRLPELLVLFSLCDQVFFYNPNLTHFINFFPNFSLFTVDLAYLFYILTFTTNFFMYYLFNQKFRATFSQWTHVKPK